MSPNFLIEFFYFFAFHEKKKKKIFPIVLFSLKKIIKGIYVIFLYGL